MYIIELPTSQYNWERINIIYGVGAPLHVESEIDTEITYYIWEKISFNEYIVLKENTGVNKPTLSYREVNQEISVRWRKG